jgi:hypothetical protein
VWGDWEEQDQGQCSAYSVLSCSFIWKGVYDYHGSIHYVWDIVYESTTTKMAMVLIFEVMFGYRASFTFLIAIAAATTTTTTTTCNMKSIVFRDVTRCSLEVCRHFGATYWIHFGSRAKHESSTAASYFLSLLLDFDDGGSMLFLNVNELLPDSQPHRRNSAHHSHCMRTSNLHNLQDIYNCKK